MAREHVLKVMERAVGQAKGVALDHSGSLVLSGHWSAMVDASATVADLLEACKVASALLKGLPRSLGYDHDAKQLDAAIAKAEGKQREGRGEGG